jgi:CRISPR type III-B/RAMP module RAMP protein Cmr1
MRFWLRALLGGVLGDRPDKIFQCESQVFGSTDHASPVVVQVSHQNLPSIGYSELTRSRTGIAYLFFGARLTQAAKPSQMAANFPAPFI